MPFMAYRLGQLLFTPAVKALQERYGSRRQYDRLQRGEEGEPELGDVEKEFIADRDSFYMATVGSSGWPYVQHRGGPKGFLTVADERTLAFADFRGNRQYVSAGNLATDARVALILVDYPARARLKILGHATILEAEQAAPWQERLRNPDYDVVVERVFLIRVAAFDWNCPQHITPRFSTEDVERVLSPLERRVDELERENAALRAELGR
jgi:uncharacterized protein